MARDRRRAASQALAGLGAGLALACTPAPPAPPRAALLVTVDTLRADRLGAYGSDRGLTPHLDALARESLVFEAAYAPAPFTFPSIASLFTGRHPGEMGIVSNGSAIPADVPTLAHELRARGWRTGAVVSNFVLRRKTGLAGGFDVYDDTMEQVEAVRRWPERTAAHTTDAALAVLAALARESADAPWLLWVHYQDPHGPYTPPPGERERFLADERRAPGGDRVLPEAGDYFGHGAIPDYQIVDGHRDVAYYRAGYDGEVAHVDREVGRLLAGVAARGGPPPLVVFAADHGEALGEHDYWFAHGQHLTDELVRVPLMLRAPGVEPGRRSDVVTLLDLVPTLLPLLAGEAPEAELSGRDLLAPGAADGDSVPYLETLSASATPRFGFVEDGYKLILSLHEDLWTAQLFRLGNEDVDLAAPAPQITSRMRSRLQALRERYDLDVAETRQKLDPDEVEALRALGYLEATEP